MPQRSSAELLFVTLEVSSWSHDTDPLAEIRCALPRNAMEAVMWSRIRLDLDWLDVGAAFISCLRPGRYTEAAATTQKSWNADEPCLIALSVRSGFDLMLRALELPRGSEVLLSALTVPDMVQLVRQHGLIPVPLDTDGLGRVHPKTLKAAVTPNTRMVVLAHLFGGVMPLDPLIAIAREHQLLVVEDCAQCFSRVGEFGHPASDAAMYSFGPIKTCTALGGAVLRVSEPALRGRMQELLNGDPVQSRWSYFRRVLRFAVLKFLSTRMVASAVRFCIQCAGKDFDAMANASARGFSHDNLLLQLRKRPSVPLLRFLSRRWRSYDFRRIERRISLGRQLDSRLGRTHDESHSFWVYPLFVHKPQAVCDRLQARGFDATCLARMCVVPAVDDLRKSVNARHFWDHVIFLPWYPELPDAAVEEMAGLIEADDLLKDITVSDFEQIR